MSSTAPAAQPPVDRLAGATCRPVASIRAGQVPLVDRVGELSRLQAELSAAFAGSPRAVFLTGEAGIGKSRLLREALALAQANAATTAILFGRCLDEQGMPPYLPWHDILVDLDKADQRPPAPARALRPLLAGSEDLPERSLVAPEQRKLRLFDAVTRGIGDLAATRPVVLAFDDLQWSDAASNELLRFLLIHLPSVPLLVVGTYRTEEAAANGPLLRTVADLERHRRLTLLPISPLTAVDTLQLVAGLTSDDRLSQPLAAAIHRHCEGNPFFVEEVVRALVADDRVPDAAGAVSPVDAPLPLPRGVTAVIERRLDRVEHDCRAVLETAALIGPRIPVDLVAAAAKLEPMAVADFLDAATRAALVRPLGPEEIDAAETTFVPDFVFLHDRVRETTAARINPVRRRALHGRIADALLAADHGDDLIRLAKISHHYRLARRTGAAAGAAIRLGEAAMRAHAHAEAARAYRLAVELAPAAAELDGMTAADLLFRLGEASLVAGEVGAVDALRRAEELFFSAGDLRGVARARRCLGTAHARREEFDLAVGYLEGALSLYPRASARGAFCEPADEPEIAEVLIELGSIKGMSLGQYRDAAAVGREALTLAARHTISRPTLEARARLGLANTLMRSGRLAEGATFLRPALSKAQSAGDLNLAAEIAGALANHHYWIGDLGGSERAARLRHDLATRGGDSYALRHALPWLAFIAASRGDWDLAERVMAEGEEHVARVESPEPLAFLAKIRGFSLLMRGRHVEAIADLERAIAAFRQSGPATLVWYLGCLGTAYEAAGNSAAGAAIAAETADLIDSLPAEALPRGPALAELGIAACLRGDREAAAHWYPQLLPHAGQLHWVLVDRVLGMLAALLDDLPTAERHFVAAAATARRNAIRPELALSLAEHGLARLHAAGVADRSAAESLLREAVALLRKLGMAADVARVDHLLTEVFPGSCHRDGADRAPAALPAGLSEREAEVLSLVAQGLTNREIGTRLSISEKTVSNHLTHIFTKANLDNRAAAVAFALRQGLA